MEVQSVLIATTTQIEAEATGLSKMATDTIKIGVGIYEEYFEAGDLFATSDKR